MRKISDADYPAHFWSRVDRSGGPAACWAWLGAKTRKGYGHAPRSGKWHSAHRTAFALHCGRPAHPGLEVCHSCNHRDCCNPLHLREDTHTENVRDAWRLDGGQRPPAGEKNPRAKLTAAEVRELRAVFRDFPVTKASLGRAYGLDEVSIGYVIRRRTWRFT